MRFYKYQGAGNDFLVADNRLGDFNLTTEQIVALCDRRYGFGADGMMLLEHSAVADFKMVFYNPDGTGGMMCGNGGRCMVAFAAFLGYDSFCFEAPDGLHEAQVLSTNDQRTSMEVRLKMIDVHQVQELSNDDWYVYTGARHRVCFLAGGLDKWPVQEQGRLLRHDPAFLPEGTNVNFVQLVVGPDIQCLAVRTYEKGVEAETWACGTGIVASSIAAYRSGRLRPCASTGRVQVQVRAKKDELSVDFLPQGPVASDVWLTGPAVQVGEVIATNLPG
ncbi:MAG: diaminopimelate epimerase [Bacteroidales bacterium]|nr:diaminopimelate epimerase [Bacteroidales bacterium]